MDDPTIEHISEFHARFHAARLIARPSEAIRFDGADKTAAIECRYVLSVNLKERELVLSCTPSDCQDPALRESLAALPSEHCRFAEITVFQRATRLMPVATISLDEEPLGRIEMQQVRSALDAVASRLESAIKHASGG